MNTVANASVSIVCLIFLLVACSDNEDLEPVDLTLSVLGNWSTTCRQDSGTFVISHLEIDNETIAFREETYDDSACVSRATELYFSGSLHIGDSVELADGTIALEADYLYNSITVVTDSQELIDNYNNQEFCGRNDWLLSVSYEVIDCIFDEPVGTAFSLFAREDNILYRGNKSPGAAGDTIETRHMIVERTIPYSLQAPS